MLLDKPSTVCGEYLISAGTNELSALRAGMQSPALQQDKEGGEIVKCTVCQQKKGKRTCRLHDGAEICPLCCATIRTAEECDDCQHFAQAEQYRKERVRHGFRPKDFVMRIDDEVEEETDRALQQIAAGRLSEGEPVVRRLYEESPDLSCTQYAMGVVCLQNDDYEQAMQYFQEAVETFPYFAEAHFNLSACYRQTLQLTNSIRSLREARDMAEIGDTLHTKADEMLRDFAESILENEGVDIDTFLEAGDAFDHGFGKMEKGQVRQAIGDFQECIRLKPSSHQAYGNLGICYAKLGMKDRAYAMFDKALELNPDYEPAKWNREAVDALAAGEDIPMASIEYGAQRFIEEEEPKDSASEDKDAPATGLLEKLRRRFSRG